MRRPLLLIAPTVLAALAVASVPLFILYDDDRVAKADAVMVLAGAPNPGLRLPPAIVLEWANSGVTTVGRPC